MGKISRFEDIEAWQLSRKFARDIYDCTYKPLFSKDHALKNQIRRSAGSVMDNIAEGFERGGSKEFIQFLFVAKSSMAECRSQMYRAYDLGYISQEQLNNLYTDSQNIAGKLRNFIEYLKKSNNKGPKFQ
jgi:four helix bundle protein